MSLWLRIILIVLLIWLVVSFLVAIAIGKLIGRHQSGKCGCERHEKKP